MIPLVDLAWQHAVVAQEVQEGFARIFAKSAYVLGNAVRDFEESFASYLRVGCVVGVGSGTDALELALRAAGLRPGDEVVVPATAPAATPLAVVRAGGVPVFCDVDDEHLLIDVADAARRATKKTKAIVPVHLFGQLAKMEDVLSLADERGWLVVEDAAHCQGGTRKGQDGGCFGHCAATSFAPGMILGAYGDAGACLTNDDDTADRLRAMRDYGRTSEGKIAEVGASSRLDALQAVVLSAKLKHLDGWLRLRHEAAKRYDDRLAGLRHLRRPTTMHGNVHAWLRYVVRVPNRATAVRKLEEAGIVSGIHWPVPAHLEPAFAVYGRKPGDHPVAEQAAQQLLSLPLYPGITSDQQDRVVRALRDAL